MLEFEQTDFSMLEAMERDFYKYHELWHFADEWTFNSNKWKHDQSFVKIVPEEVASTLAFGYSLL